MAKRVSMADTILNDMRNQFVEGSFQPGELLTESEVSARYNCSKTPAREALSLLCTEGYLEKIPNKGYIVKAVTARELQHMLQFRYILESASAEYAAKHAGSDHIEQLEAICKRVEQLSCQEMSERYYALNRDFHMELARITGNPFLIAATENILNQLRRALTSDYQHMPNPLEALQGHELMVSAIRERDPTRAKQLVEEHILRSQRRIFDHGITN